MKKGGAPAGWQARAEVQNALLALEAHRALGRLGTNRPAHGRAEDTAVGALGVAHDAADELVVVTRAVVIPDEGHVGQRGRQVGVVDSGATGGQQRVFRLVAAVVLCVRQQLENPASHVDAAALVLALVELLPECGIDVALGGSDELGDDGAHALEPPLEVTELRQPGHLGLQLLPVLGGAPQGDVGNAAARLHHVLEVGLDRVHQRQLGDGLLHRSGGGEVGHQQRVLIGADVVANRRAELAEAALPVVAELAHDELVATDADFLLALVRDELAAEGLGVVVDDAGKALRDGDPEVIRRKAQSVVSVVGAVSRLNQAVKAEGANEVGVRRGAGLHRGAEKLVEDLLLDEGAQGGSRGGNFGNGESLACHGESP